MFKKLFGRTSVTEQSNLDNESSTISVIEPKVSSYAPIIKQMADYAESLGESSIFISDIPQKKLNNVKAIYNLDKEDQVNILFDATIFGSGKDGFILTNTFAGFKDSFKDPVKLSFEEVCQTNANNSSTIVVNGVSYSLSSVANKLLFQLKQLLVAQDDSMRHMYNQAIETILSDAKDLYEQEQYSDCVSFVKRKLSFVLAGDQQYGVMQNYLFDTYLASEQFTLAEEMLTWFEQQAPEKLTDLKQKYDTSYTNYIEQKIEQKLNKYNNLVEAKEFSTLLTVKEELDDLLEILPTSQYKVQVEEAFTYSQYARNQYLIQLHLDDHEYKEALEMLENEVETQFLTEQQIKDQYDHVVKLKSDYIRQCHDALVKALETGDIETAEQQLNNLKQHDDQTDYTKEKISLLILQDNVEEAEKHIVLLAENEQSIYIERIEQQKKNNVEKVVQLLKLRDFNYFIKNPEWISLQDEFGMTAIHYAAAEGHLDAFKKLYPIANMSEKTYLGHTVNELMTKTFIFKDYLKVTDENYQVLLKKSTSKSVKERTVKFTSGLAAMSAMSDSEARRRLDPEAYTKYVEYKKDSEQYLNNQQNERDRALREAENYADDKYNQLNKSYLEKIVNFLKAKQVDPTSNSVEQIESKCAEIKQKIEKIVQADKVALEVTEAYKEAYSDYKMTLAKKSCGEKDEFETTEMYEQRLTDIFGNIEVSDAAILEQWRKMYVEKSKKAKESQLEVLLTELKALELSKENTVKRAAFASRFVTDASFREAYFTHDALEMKQLLDLEHYDADNETFEMKYYNEIIKLKVPLKHAKQFKEMFDELEMAVDFYVKDNRLYQRVIYLLDENRYETAIKMVF